MAKILRCGDLMPGCPAIVEGPDVAEVMAKAMDHYRQDHRLRMIPSEFAARMQSAITDGQTKAARSLTGPDRGN